MANTKFKEGQEKRGGRKKGTPNKTTVKIKQAILNAFDEAGGVDYLVEVAKSDPRTFCALLGRVLPTELKHEIEHVEKFETTEEIMAKVESLRQQMADLDKVR